MLHPHDAPGRQLQSDSRAAQASNSNLLLVQLACIMLSADCAVCNTNHLMFTTFSLRSHACTFKLAVHMCELRLRNLWDFRPVMALNLHTIISGRYGIDKCQISVASTDSSFPLN